ncbi:MAG TPA: hypothetical protein VGM66_08740, partial [Candidatus Udaeobacter sp.]
MKQTAIHLSESFEEVLATLLTLPSTLAEIDEVRFPEADDSELRKSAKCVAEVGEALRSLYEAAHGRQVETPIGFLPIAPPVAGFLKKKPYYVATQHEFFLEAFTRILVGDSPRKGQTNRSCTPGSKRATRSGGINGHSSHARRLNGNVL